MITKFVTKVFEILDSNSSDDIDAWFDELATEFTGIEIVGYSTTMNGLVITVEVEYDDELEECGGMPH